MLKYVLHFEHLKNSKIFHVQNKYISTSFFFFFHGFWNVLNNTSKYYWENRKMSQIKH